MASQGPVAIPSRSPRVRAARAKPRHNPDLALTLMSALALAGTGLIPIIFVALKAV